MQAITTIGLDIAKSVFQVHGVDAEGNVVLRRQLKRRYIFAFFQNRRAWSVSKPAPPRIIKAAHERFAHQRLQPRHASLIGATDAAAPAAWRSSPPTAAPRRASADLVAERCDAAIRPEVGEKQKRAACA
jgi:hypothetical protein